MVPCAAIGDSIAVGVGQARPECSTTAQVGITSERYIASLLPLAETGADTTIISLGVNDDASVDTLDNLRKVRRRVSSRTVFWLLPGIKEQVREDIATVAQENGDRLIDTRPQAGRDHIHPNGAGYQQIAAQTYGGGTSYASESAPPPVEVAEAPAHLPDPGDSAFHVDYSGLARRHAARLANHQLYFTNAPRRLSSLATPRERIRNLRAERHAEATPLRAAHSHGAVETSRAAMGGRAMPVPPQPVATEARHVHASARAPAAGHTPVHAESVQTRRSGAMHAARQGLRRAG